MQRRSRRKPRDSSSVIELRARVQSFIRRFGLLEPARTPCGQPLPVSAAHALMVLHQTTGLRQGELAARLSLEKSTVSRMVRRLERQGYVRCRPDTGDRRAVRLHPTVRGRSLARRLDQSSRARFAEILGHLGEGELDVVLAGLTRLIEATSAPNTDGQDAVTV